MSSTANGIHSGKKCFTIIGLRLNNSQTLRNQTLLNMQTELIFSQEDSHAKMPPSQNNMEKASKDLMEYLEVLTPEVVEVEVLQQLLVRQVQRDDAKRHELLLLVDQT